MSRSLNKVMLIGNVGKDPEVSYLENGVPVAKFSIATDESWKDKEGTKHDKVEWHNIVAWRKLAEIIGQYITKGSKVFVEGKLQTRSWDDKNTGVKKYMTEIVIDNLVMLGGKNPSGEGDAAQPEAQVQGGGPANADTDLPF